ncbi:hypothetical protein ACSSS7_001015 [Eimeria intestinalis]
MPVIFLRALLGVSLAFMASNAAEHSEHVPPPFPVDDTTASVREFPSPSPAEASAAPEELVREPEQVGSPFLATREEAQKQASDEELLASQRLVLGALRFETLFNYMTEMQQRFFRAILPDSWAVPKFLPSVNSDLEEVHNFVRQIAQASGAGSIPAALQQLAESGRLQEILQGSSILPPAFEHLLSASTSTSTQSGGSSNPLARLLPTLNLNALEVISRLFRVPSELEFPVSPDGLSLFLPVVVRDVSSAAEPVLSEGAAQDVMASVNDILVPVVDHEGQLLFADAPSVFHGIDLPAQLAIRPLALFSAFEGEDVSGLWNAVKAPMLSRLSLLGSEAPALFGPVMTLASLPRVALSLNGENQPATGTNQLARIVGEVSSRLRTALRSFEDLWVSEVVPASTQALMREPLEEFLNMRFLNFSIPIVGLARELEPGALTPLPALSQCTTSDCPLGLSLPSFPEFLVAPDQAIHRLQAEIETLTVQLQAAIQQLQSRINTSLPQGVSRTADSQGVSLDEVLNTTLSLTDTLQDAVGIAGERVNKLLTVESVSPEDRASIAGLKHPAGVTSQETRAPNEKAIKASGARTPTGAEKLKEPASLAALLQAKQNFAQVVAGRRRANGEGQRSGTTAGTKTSTAATEKVTTTPTAPSKEAPAEDGLLAPRRQLQVGWLREAASAWDACSSSVSSLSSCKLHAPSSLLGKAAAFTATTKLLSFATRRGCCNREALCACCRASPATSCNRRLVFLSLWLGPSSAAVVQSVFPGLAGAAQAQQGTPREAADSLLLSNPLPFMLWGPLGQHRRAEGVKGGPTQPLTRGCLGAAPADFAPTAAAYNHPAPSSSSACPEDGDGDLEPPRRHKGVSPEGVEALRSASSISRRRSLQAGEGTPALCFWVCHMKAHDVSEVGRGLWSAAVAMGRFLIEHPHILGGPPQRGRSPIAQGCKHGEGAPRSFTCSPEPPDAAPESSSLRGSSEDLGKACKTYRILELGSGVGFLGPVLNRLVRGACRGAPGGASQPHVSSEIYLTDVEAGALRLCQCTQRLDESLLGSPRGSPPEKSDPLTGSSALQKGGLPNVLWTSSAAEAKAKTVESASEASQLRTPVSVRVRRLDWRHGGPWASALRARSSATTQGPAAAPHNHGHEAFSHAEGPPSQRASADPFEWLPEEIEALQVEGAIDLVLACDVLYDFDLNEALAEFLQILLKRNPKSRCLLAHTRRLGIVCPTSSVPVDVFAEDFWDRFCVRDPHGEPQQSKEANAAPFEVHVHSKPAPASLVFSAVSAPGEWFRFESCVPFLLMAVRAPSQELYSALLSGEAMKEALQWDDATPGSRPNDSWRNESRDEYRGHRWVARSPTWAPTSAREPHADLGSTIPRLQHIDREEAPIAAAAAALAVSHEFCSLAFREALEAKGASRRPQAHCTQTIVVGIDRAGDDPALPQCSVHNFCKLQQLQQQQGHEITHCCHCRGGCCKQPYRKEDMWLPAQQHQEQREQEQQQRNCPTRCEAQQQQQQQQRRLMRGYLPSRGGLGRRRNEALLQRVGGGYQLYGPVSWASFKAVDAQTNTPADAARHAATQTAAGAAVAATATARGAKQAAAAVAAAGNSQIHKRKERRWYPRQQRYVSSGASLPDRTGAPSASHGKASSCCCCCCCCSGSQNAGARAAAANPQCSCAPSRAGPATAATAASMHAAAVYGMPTVILEPRENIRAATASAHRCRSTMGRGSRPQQRHLQQHQQHQQQQQGMLQAFCRETIIGSPFASSRVSGGAKRKPLFRSGEGGPQTGLPGGPPSVLQGYAGLLSGALRGPAMQSQQAVARKASSTWDIENPRS